LIVLFSSQFSALANREIEGMDNLIRSFAAIVEDFKRKPYGTILIPLCPLLQAISDIQGIMRFC
jgi:hypothetical protein